MTKEIKCILVDVDKVLISEIEEVDAELGNPNCKLTNPVVFESLEKMKPLLEASNKSIKAFAHNSSSSFLDFKSSKHWANPPALIISCTAPSTADN